MEYSTLMLSKDLGNSSKVVGKEKTIENINNLFIMINILFQLPTQPKLLCTQKKCVFISQASARQACFLRGTPS